MYEHCSTTRFYSRNPSAGGVLEPAGMEMERAKRRKLDHETGNHIPGSLDSADAAGFLKPGAFILETEELLKEVRVDYGALEDVEQLLHSVKNCIEAIEPHGPLPVSLVLRLIDAVILTSSRSSKRLRSLRRTRKLPFPSPTRNLRKIRPTRLPSPNPRNATW